MQKKKHQQVAQYLEEEYIEREAEIAEELAYNYFLAQEEGKAVRYSLLAAQQAKEKYANEDAIRYYTWAIDMLLEQQDMDKLFPILLDRELVYGLLGEREAQRKDLAKLEHLSKASNDIHKQIQAGLRRVDYAEVAGNHSEAIVVAQEVIRLAKDIQNISGEAAGNQKWGAALVRQGEYEAAQTQLEKALDIVRSGEIREVEADTLHSLALILRRQGNFEQADTLSEQALSIYRDLGDLRGECTVFSHLAVDSYSQSECIDGRDYYHKALDIARQIGDRQREARGFINLAWISLELGAYPEAISQLKESLRISREVGHRKGESHAIMNLGLISYLTGNDKTSIDYNQQALRIIQEIGNRHDEGFGLTGLGNSLANLGKEKEAISVYQQALSLRQELDQPNQIMETLAGMARLFLAQGNLAQAQAQTEKILTHLKSKTLTGTDEPFQVYLTCYRVLDASKDPRAKTILDKAYHLLQEQATKVTDEELRRSFLENVRVNAEIIQLKESKI